MFKLRIVETIPELFKNINSQKQILRGLNKKISTS